MFLLDIAILLAAFFIIGLIRNPKLRTALITVASVLFVFYLQPLVPIRNFDYWFPFLTLSFTLLTWAFCARDPDLPIQTHRDELGLILFPMLIVATSRHTPFNTLFTASRPPALWLSLPTIAFLFILLTGSVQLLKKNLTVLYSVLITLLISLLVIIKMPYLALKASEILRSISGQQIDSALASDIRWLGYSYIAFRLLSVVIDRKKGRKLFVSPGQFVSYVCFPPALAAGPIDRLDRFAKSLAGNFSSSIPYDDAFQRLAIGAFKKFILADGLAFIALSQQNHAQFQSSCWAWSALIAYSLQIYFDFSGYTDIAIGLGLLAGIRLPENFNHPYLKADIAKFWNNWHMTLTQWIRSYVFNPLTRKLRSNKQRPLPQWLIVLLAQSVTMGLIGAWHGVTFNFLIWGAWHAFGLFIHQLYNDRMKDRLLALQQRPQIYQLYTLLSWLLTFLFVALGWVWFVLAEPGDAMAFYRTLLMGRIP
jgi:D-alanyl-lipoteichoic acid acyltransferase DltB (MBOAT superfamily)